LAVVKAGKASFESTPAVSSLPRISRWLFGGSSKRTRRIAQ
jgi:hypothetical protein